MLSQCLSESGQGRGMSLQRTFSSSLWKLLLEHRAHVNNHSSIGQASFLSQSCPFLVCLPYAGVLLVRTRVYTDPITIRTVYSSVQIIAVITVLMIPIKPDYLSIKTKTCTIVHAVLSMIAEQGFHLYGSSCVDQGPSTTNHVMLPLISSLALASSFQPLAP